MNVSWGKENCLKQNSSVACSMGELITPSFPWICEFVCVDDKGAHLKMINYTFLGDDTFTAYWSACSARGKVVLKMHCHFISLCLLKNTSRKIVSFVLLFLPKYTCSFLQWFWYKCSDMHLVKVIHIHLFSFVKFPANLVVSTAIVTHIYFY